MKMRPHRFLYRLSSPLAAISLFAVLVMLAGCGAAKSGTLPTDPPATLPTVTIAVSPASIAAGASSMLTVSATSATQVTVAGSDGTSYALSANGGTQAVTPAATTTYTVNATGAGGQASGTATVTVTGAPPPAATVTIAASPASIAAGKSSTLTVTATHANAVILTGSDGSNYSLSATGGTQSVAPAATTTYTAKATGSAGNASATAVVTVTNSSSVSVTIVASPTDIVNGGSSTLTVAAANASTVIVTGSDRSSYNLAAKGGTQKVTPASTTTYTAEATGAKGTASDSATVTVAVPGSTAKINHVIFMLQENHTFDNYFGMLNNYRRAKGLNTGDDGNVYKVDGIDDKLNISNKDKQGVAHTLYKFKSTCVDDMSSAWSESYADVSLGNLSTTRQIKMNGYVSNADGFANSKCKNAGPCAGYTDLSGDRAMGYYDEDFLNYYYYMASQFAVSDRWFSPIASKSTPNRIAAYSGGTTHGLAFDPGYDDHVGSLNVPSIFQALDNAGVSWRVYYSDTAAECGSGDDDCGSGPANYPASTLGYITYTKRYLYQNPSHAACSGTTKQSSTVGDPANYFCIDTNHVAPLATYFTDLNNGTLPALAFIEPAYGVNDEHPGSFQSILLGQQQMAKIINAFMASPEWKDGVFFFSYDEGGGPYDHVPPVPHHSNANTDVSLGSIPDIAGIAVNPDTYNPCVPATPPATPHCDLRPNSPGAHPGDAAAVNGFAAQIGFRVPNMVISPFTRRHYVSHIPMDHTAVIKFIEDRFIGNGKYLTARDAAQPSMLDFFDFNSAPWATPPTPPVPASNSSLGHNTCTPANM
jgi:phospholipase C